VTNAESAWRDGGKPWLNWWTWVEQMAQLGSRAAGGAKQPSDDFGRAEAVGGPPYREHPSDASSRVGHR